MCLGKLSLLALSVVVAMKNLHSILFVADSSLPHWTELGGKAPGILLWFGHPCFPIVPKRACERGLGGSREEGHGGRA